LPQRARKRRPRVVVDTSVLVAGISGFREPFVPGKNPSPDLRHSWAEKSNFVWLATEEVLDEYKEVLKRMPVRSHLIGTVINLIRERAEEIDVRLTAGISPGPKASCCGAATVGRSSAITAIVAGFFLGGTGILACPPSGGVPHPSRTPGSLGRSSGLCRLHPRYSPAQVPHSPKVTPRLSHRDAIIRLSEP